jgi:hypothetical protein
MGCNEYHIYIPADVQRILRFVFGDFLYGFSCASFFLRLLSYGVTVLEPCITELGMQSLTVTRVSPLYR